MSTSTKSQFFYGHEITINNQSLDFSEGGSELQATLNIGDYALSEFTGEVERALNAAGALTYTVSVDRSTRIITISATGNFELLVTSGTRAGTSCYSLIGFTGADQTGAATYDGDSASGSVWKPQAVLRSYIPFEDSKEFVKASVNESASGIVETLSFGRTNFMEATVELITDVSQGANSPIDNNASGRQDARDFLDFATKKAKIEFMEDRDSPNTFTKCILESTASNKDGVGYELPKMFSEGITGYYTTGKLVFRKVT